jgi:TusA-related sulfurtransferase
MEITPDESLDLRGKECPFTIMEIGNVLRSLKAGQILEVIAGSGSAIDDIRSWCAGTGTELVGTHKEDGVRVYLRRPVYG